MIGLIIRYLLCSSLTCLDTTNEDSLFLEETTQWAGHRREVSAKGYQRALGTVE